jgi:hypothetical protein
MILRKPLNVSDFHPFCSQVLMVLNKGSNEKDADTLLAMEEIRLGFAELFLNI